MDLAPLSFLVTVVAGAMPALWRALPRGAVQNHRRGLVGTARTPAQQHPQIVDHGLEAACRDPAVGLLVDRVPAGKVIRQHAPGSTGTHDPAHGVEDLAQIMTTRGASSLIRVRYGATNAHSSSLTSLG